MKKTELRLLVKDFVYDTFKKPIHELNVILYEWWFSQGGRMPAFMNLDEITFVTTRISYNGKMLDYDFNWYLPEELAPYPDNTVFLINVIYEYEYEREKKFIHDTFGIPYENICWARPLILKLLDAQDFQFGYAGADRIAKLFFDKYGMDISSIRYLDIGANHYLLHNNTYLFHKNRASGVLIEPNPDFRTLLETNRPGDKVLSYGCLPESMLNGNEKLKYYRTNRAGYNTFYKEGLKHFPPGVYLQEEVDVRVRSIEDIVEEYFPNRYINYVTIDAEGMGAAILDAMLSCNVIMDVIIIEMNTENTQSRKLYLKLKRLGYGMLYYGIGTSQDFLFYNKNVFKNNEINKSIKNISNRKRLYGEIR